MICWIAFSRRGRTRTLPRGRFATRSGHDGACAMVGRKSSPRVDVPFAPERSMRVGRLHLGSKIAGYLVSREDFQFARFCGQSQPMEFLPPSGVPRRRADLRLSNSASRRLGLVSVPAAHQNARRLHRSTRHRESNAHRSSWRRLLYAGISRCCYCRTGTRWGAGPVAIRSSPCSRSHHLAAPSIALGANKQRSQRDQCTEARGPSAPVMT